MFVSSDRRRRDREIRRAAANRRIGHDHAYLIVMGPFLHRVGALLLIAAGALAAWHFVDRELLAGVTGGAGALILIAYLARALKGSTTQARLMSIAQGTAHRGRYWHVAGAAGALLVAAAIAMVTQ